VTKALTILHVEAGRHLYGGALQVMYLLRGLAAQGQTNVLVCPSGSAIAKAASDHVQVFEVSMGGDLDLAFVYRLRRIIKDVRPDLVHLHSRRGADVLGGIAARWAGVPVILTRRVDNPEPRWWARRKYRLYDRVVTISEGIAAVLRQEGVDAEHITVVRSAVDTERYHPKCDRAWFRESFKLSSAGAVIGMVAQFIERKGHRCLLDALPVILREFPQTQFLLFGKGPLESDITARVLAQNLTNNVRPAGFRDDLHRVLPCLDVLVHPAEMEGLGVSLLQASAAGVPVVATGVGGIPEAVRDGLNGLLIAPNDPPALAEALLTLLRDPVWAKTLGANGRLVMKKEFSISSMVEGNLRVYREVTAGRS